MKRKKEQELGADHDVSKSYQRTEQNTLSLDPLLSLLKQDKTPTFSLYKLSLSQTNELNHGLEDFVKSNK